MKTPVTLSDFIEAEMRRRNMNVVEFANLLGVSHASISRHLSRRKRRPRPQIDFLLKLVDKTGVNLITLLVIAYPEVAGRVGLGPRAMLLAERFDKLPEAVQDFIITSVLGSGAFSEGNHGGNP
jgi:hypothetical protein